LLRKNTVLDKATATGEGVNTGGIVVVTPVQSVIVVVQHINSGMDEHGADGGNQRRLEMEFTTYIIGCRPTDETGDNTYQQKGWARGKKMSRERTGQRLRSRLLWHGTFLIELMATIYIAK
jgi:hypothetical protein